MESEIDNFYFKHPFTCVIAGSTGSGKTHFLTNLLLNSERLIDKPIQNLVYCYGQYLNDTFAQLKKKFPNIKLIEGLDNSLNFNPQKINVLIIDDLMTDCVKSSEICDYFTKGSHHLNLSVILLSQNIFQKGNFTRTINMNAHYVIYFKNPRDNQQIQFIARQMFPGKSNILNEAYTDAVSRPHGYIFIDFKQSTPDWFRLKTNILPSDPGPAIVYLPK